MCSSQTHARFVLWTYTRTAWLFAYRMVLYLKPDILFLIQWRFFYMKLFVLMQPPSSKSTFAGGNSETDKLEKHEMECQESFWILNLWPGGLLWNTNGWIRNRREMSEKCFGQKNFWCVFYTDVCIQYVLFISAFLLSKGNTTWCFDIKSILFNKKVK